MKDARNDLSSESSTGFEYDLKDLRTSNNLIMLQSRLYAPAYAGPGRWIIVDAASKRSFLAAGSDIIPDVIRILEDACDGFKPEKQDCWVKHARQKIAKLVSTGLLLDGKCPERSLTDLYHQFSYDYPFQDYGVPDWRESDAALMEQYAAISPPPPTESVYSGEATLLRELNFKHDFNAVNTWTKTDRLAFLLKFVFGKIGEISSKLMTCPRRTSPSGGARHPTDVIVELGNDWPNLSSDRYHYDTTRHALVKAETGLSAPVPGSHCVLTLVSTVERAMWRYRDARSYRPVLIDLGHIAEMIVLVSEFLGFKTRVSLPEPGSDAGVAWINCPDLFRIEIAEDQFEDSVRPATPGRIESSATQPASLLVNPLMYFSMSDAGIVCRTTWPATKSLRVYPDDFHVFNHCIPSQRGDRDTTWLGIRTKTGVSSERLMELYDANILIDHSTATAIYSRVRMWSKYGWYLSLLLCSETRSLRDGRILPGSDSWPNIPARSKTLKGLLQRKTCRAFNPEQLTREQLEKIVSVGSDAFGIRTIVCVYESGELEGGVFEFQHGTFVRLRESPSRTEVARATIGQYPSSSAAITIWLLMPLSTEDNGADYHSKIISLGRVAHRICVTCNDLGLGVFMTPALYETSTLNLLHINLEPDRCIPYLLSIGKRAK